MALDGRCYDPAVSASAYDIDPMELTAVPRAAIQLPLEVPLPAAFDPERLDTWPAIDGRLELVEGRLLFMPPCGDDQQFTAADVTAELALWSRRREGFVVGTNEAGMKLGDDVRAADAAVWRRADVGVRTGGLLRVPPVLAVEIAGRDDTVEALRRKATWYLEHGVAVVWLLVPRTREVHVIDAEGETRLDVSARLPERPELPGLAPRVADLFRQLG